MSLSSCIELYGMVERPSVTCRLLETIGGDRYIVEIGSLVLKALDDQGNSYIQPFDICRTQGFFQTESSRDQKKKKPQREV